MARSTPLRKRSYAPIVWLVVLAAGIVGGRRWYVSRRQPGIVVRVHRVERTRVRDLVSTMAAGRVAAAREATMRAEIAATVAHLHHRRGERVSAGDALVTYDSADLRDRVRVAEAALALGRAQTLQAEANSRVLRSTATRSGLLRDHGAAPAAEAENLSGQAEVAERAASASRTALEQMAANVELARDALRRSVVRAPFAGMVLTTSIEEGEVSVPGTPLLSLADTSGLHIDAELDESDLGRVAVGMPAEVSLDAFPQQRFAGTLSEIAPSVTRDLRGNRSIAIRVSLVPDARLRVGMSADVDVIVATRDSVISIPPNAVLGRGTDRAVMVVEQGFARRRAISVGIATWEAIEVTRGVRENDRVIVTLSATDLADGVRVEPRAEETSLPTREASR